jgi:protein-serine/threonine kinase
MTGHGQSSKSHAAAGIGSTLGPHRGAIDQTTTTTQPPPEVIKQVKQVLETMGVEIQVESEYKYRCIRARRQNPSEDVVSNLYHEHPFAQEPSMTFSPL